MLPCMKQLSKRNKILAAGTSLVAIALAGWIFFDRHNWNSYQDPSGSHTYIYPRTWVSNWRISQDPVHLDKNQTLEIKFYKPVAAYCDKLETCVLRRQTTIPSIEAFRHPEQIGYLNYRVPVQKKVGRIEYFIQQRDAPEFVNDRCWLLRDGILIEINYYSSIGRQTEGSVIRKIINSLKIDPSAVTSTPLP